jgi:hypothetical protein
MKQIVGRLCILAAGLLGLCAVVPDGYGETFSFAVIADPHIDGTAAHTTKLQTAVNWIIANKTNDDIELAFVVGDIAWGGPATNRNMVVAKGILDQLNLAGIPYIPIIGDNEATSGCDLEFANTFGAQYSYLSGILSNWTKAALPVNGKYLQNFSFDYKYCHAICADFVSRTAGVEYGDLHDFTGGSWPWFTNNIAACAKPKKENIMVMTHIGMFRTGIQTADQYLFSEADLNTIKNFTKNYKSYITANYAGHIHCNWTQDVIDGWWIFGTLIYTSRVTDETWYDVRGLESSDTTCTVRWVSVNNGSSTIAYTQHTVDVD